MTRNRPITAIVPIAEMTWFSVIDEMNTPIATNAAPMSRTAIVEPRSMAPLYSLAVPA